MNLAEASAIVYGPEVKYDVVIDFHEVKGLQRFILSGRELNVLLKTETRLCEIFVDGLLARRVR